MEILWAQGGREITGREVADQLPENAYTTVATVLDRLVRKELVHRRLDGRKIRFTPVGSPGAHAAVLMRQAMEVGSDPGAALATFVRTLSPSEVATLREAIAGADLESAGSAS
jgi:predicted transcriptional regulator